MKTGDPKKAAMLGVVAVVVLGAAVFQILPKGQPATPRKAPPAAEQTPSGDVGALVVSAQERLQKDPFTHPKLQKGVGETEAAKEAAKQVTVPPPPLSGDLGTLPEIGGNDPVRPPAPGGNASTSQQSEGAKLKDTGKQVMLEAIVSVQRSKAFIKVGGEDALGYLEGQKLPGVGVVTRIGDASITIRTPRGSKTLHVGSEKKL
ncbi:MAG: hypothetical protein WAO58_08740 [Fimbriimonadaceae bacterium]